MSVYMIIDVEVKDNETYSKYIEKVPEIINKHGGRYLTRGGKITPIRGNWNPEKIVMIEFETTEQLKKCFNQMNILK